MASVGIGFDSDSIKWLVISVGASPTGGTSPRDTDQSVSECMKILHVGSGVTDFFHSNTALCCGGATHPAG